MKRKKRQIFLKYKINGLNNLQQFYKKKKSFYLEE